MVTHAKHVSRWLILGVCNPLFLITHMFLMSKVFPICLIVTSPYKWIYTTTYLMLHPKPSYNIFRQSDFLNKKAHHTRLNLPYIPSKYLYHNVAILRIFWWNWTYQQFGSYLWIGRSLCQTDIHFKTKISCQNSWQESSKPCSDTEISF